jgi:hypothetical protein
VVPKDYHLWIEIFGPPCLRHPVSVMFTAKDGRAPGMLLRGAVMVGSCYVASRRHSGMISRGSMGAGGWILVVVLPRIPPELRPW